MVHNKNGLCKHIILLFSLIIIFSIVFFSFLVHLSAQANVNIVINGETVLFDENKGHPYMDVNNRVQVPLRAVMTAAGVNVQWLESEQTVHLEKDKINVLVPTNADYILVDGKKVKNDTVATVKNDRVYIPIRIIFETYGYKVNWDENSSTVMVNTSIAENTAYDFSGIDSVFNKMALLYGGCSFYLQKDNGIIYKKAYGNYTFDTVIPIMSASKWLSGATLMSLVDEGKLSLDDKISKYLPNFKDGKEDITIRELFSHTSGLPSEFVGIYNIELTLEECVDKIAKLKLRSTPGTEFCYGGVSMQVAGRICEIVSGTDWESLFETKIAHPLDMKNTNFYRGGKTKNPLIGCQLQKFNLVVKNSKSSLK